MYKIHYFDNFMLKPVQRAYDHMWDHYGLTKGTLLAVTVGIIGLSIVFEYEGLVIEIIAIAMLPFIFYFCSSIRNYQINGEFDIVNYYTNHMRASPFFLVFRIHFLVHSSIVLLLTIMSLIIAIFEPIPIKLFDILKIIVYCVFPILSNLFILIKVRNRQEPEYKSNYSYEGV